MNRGCHSAAKVLRPRIQKIFCNQSQFQGATDDSFQYELFDDPPLLSRFNLQGFYSNVWEHPDLQHLLVTLVEACDKESFRLVVESVLQINQRRNDELAGIGKASEDLAPQFDPYRTILYLAKYQCTSVFHAFFPTTLKPCKGYHFWCAIGSPLPVFDRLLRDAFRRVNNNRDQPIATPVFDVSDIALAFRCVFGHLI